MENIDIRIMVSEEHVRYKDIAKKLQISPQYLSTLMRYTLSPAMRQRIINAVEELRNDKDRL